MAGLLDGVLPWVYSQSDRLKRGVSGLLSDPVGTLEQTAGGLLDSHRAQQGLLSKAFADPKRPMRVTDQDAMMQAAMNMLNGPLGFAPAGITAWHGSPHKFDKFDSSKIGTGEGAQAYGHGLYLAEKPGVAQSYADSLGGGQFGSTSASKGSIADRLSNMFYGDGSNFSRGNRDISTLAKNMAQKTKTDADGLVHHQFKDGSEWIGSPSGWDVANTEKYLYKVDLPDEHIAKMLDYDNPVSEAIRSPLSKAALEQFGSGLTGTRGEKLYNEVIFNFKQAGHPNPTQAATDWLTQQGVPGMRYLDGGSRGAGAGTSNYVVFPGNENLLQILERNGVPIK